jgi:HK97 family phage portal protein
MKIRDLIPFRRKPPTEAKSWTMTMSDGLMNKDWDLGWWQQNLKGPQMSANETVEACVSTLAQTVSMCPIHHLSEGATGEIERKWGSNVERVLKGPNPYQTRTQFFNTAIRSLYFNGNAFGYATRDARGAIDRIDLLDPRSTRGVFSSEDGNIFYWASPLSQGPSHLFNSETDFVIPARSMLHLRINTDRNPLKGETPITAAANSIMASSALTGHQARFFNNMARPSGG